MHFRLRLSPYLSIIAAAAATFPLSEQDEKLITVLMPVYNAEDFVAQAVQSILDQTFTDFELLIINDGCTDGSMSIVSEFTDPRIRVEHNPENLGLIATLNRGLEMINTKYLARMDADDTCRPDRLQIQFDLMESNPNLGACSSWFDSISPEGKITPGGRYLKTHDEIKLRLLHQMNFVHGGSMLRMKTVHDHKLRFDPGFKHAEDYDFFDRLSTVSELQNVQQPLYNIRSHPLRVSYQFSEIQNANSSKIKTRIFKRLGVEANENALHLISEFLYQNYSELTGLRKSELMNFLVEILEANKSSEYFPPDFLRQRISTRFLHMCNYLAFRDDNVFSLLSGFGFLKITDSPKLFLTTYAKAILGKFRTIS